MIATAPLVGAENNMNNTYNRMLTLVVNERLEEGKKLDAIKKGAKKVILPIAATAALAVGANKAHEVHTNPERGMTADQVDVHRTNKSAEEGRKAYELSRKLRNMVGGPKQYHKSNK